MKTKVLIISYLFYPSVGAGTQRITRLANSFVKRGYDVTVICASDSEREYDYVENPGKLETGISILYFTDPAVKIYRSTSKFKWLLRKAWTYFSFPDRHFLWFLKNRRKFDAAIHGLKPKIVISTHSPITNHFVAVYLKKSLHDKFIWVADFRDAWSNNPTFLMKKEKHFWGFLRPQFERFITGNADYVTSVSPTCLNYLLISTQNRLEKAKVFPNGYLRNTKNARSQSSRFGLFEIIFVGSLYAERNPNIFLPEFERFLDTLTDKQKNKVRLTFIGDKSGEAEHAITQSRYYNTNILMMDAVHFSEVEKLMLKSVIGLILIDNFKESEAVLTSKVFDYISVHLEILAICSEKTEVGKFLKKAGSESIFLPHDTSNIVQYLMKSFQEWEGGRSNFFQLDEKVINYYEQENLFSNFIKEIN